MHPILRARPFALALAALATLASCDSAPPLDSELLPPDGAVLAAAPFPAPANFTVTAPAQPEGKTMTLAWEDVPGDEGYLIQWRKGETGTWKSLVSTGANRTTYATDSATAGVANYYRVAVMTRDFQVGAFSTALPKPRIFTYPPTLTSDSTATLNAIVRSYSGPATWWFELGTDSLLAGATQTPARSGGSAVEPIAVVPGTTYYYRAVVSSAGGTGHGAIVRFNAGAPDAPAAITATFSAAPRPIGMETYSSYAYSAAHQVFVEWTHDGNGVSQFRAQRRLVGSATWTDVVEPQYYYSQPRRRVDEAFPVSSSREYDYRVLACNARGQCASSAEVRVATQGLAPPAVLTATRAADGRVVLSWQDVGTEQSYSVQWRAGETGNWQTIVSTGANVLTYTTDRVTAGVTNHYRVAGEVKSFRAGAYTQTSVAAGAGRSMQVQTGSFTLPSGTTAVMNGAVTPNGLPAMAWIEWGTDPSLAGASATAASPVGSGISAVPFSDTVAVASGQTYYYRAAASNTVGTVRGAIQTFHAGPPSPAVVTPVFDLPNYRMVVTWTHDGRGTPSVVRRERRSAGQTAWTLMSESSHSDFPANVVRTYEYRVTLCNAANECSVSEVATGKTQPLAAPAGLTARRRSDGLMILEWQDIVGEVGYLVQWRTDPAGPWQPVVSTVANVKSYGTPKVTPGVTNYYRVTGEASGYRQGLHSEISIFVP